MYQWVDPESGTTQLSGKPPPWYRSGEGGPRVYVFDKGKVIDDTGIAVSDSERERLRHQALLSVEQNSQQVREKLLEAKRLQAALERDKRNRQSTTDTDQPPVTKQQPNPKEQPPAKAVPTEEAMRALLLQWDKIRTEQAQQAVSSGDTAAPAVDLPPPPPPPPQ